MKYVLDLIFIVSNKTTVSLLSQILVLSGIIGCKTDNAISRPTKSIIDDAPDHCETKDADIDKKE